MLIVSTVLAGFVMIVMISPCVGLSSNSRIARFAGSGTLSPMGTGCGRRATVAAVGPRCDQIRL